MKYEYEMPIHIDLSKAIPAVNELCESVNASLATFGVDERMRVLSSIGSLTLTVDSELTPQQMKEVGDMLSLTIRSSSLSAFGVTTESLRRKSGNSQLSAE